jgi:hypothetical protein
MSGSWLRSQVSVTLAAHAVWAKSTEKIKKYDTDSRHVATVASRFFMFSVMESMVEDLPRNFSAPVDHRCVWLSPLTQGAQCRFPAAFSGRDETGKPVVYPGRKQIFRKGKCWGKCLCLDAHVSKFLLWNDFF